MCHTEPSPIRRLLCGVLSAFAVFLVTLGQACAWVAEVTLTAGPVWRVDDHGRREDLQPKARLDEGARIVTGAGGLVHLRFVDGAHLGLRESSELKIVAYRSNPGRISLELARGTARHISGDYARQDPQSFRLSTPVAAIGVRGTDFVTGVRDDKTFALLLEGAILVSQSTCRTDCRETLIAQPQTLATIDLAGGVQTRQLEPAEIRQLIGGSANAKATQGAIVAGDATGKLPANEVSVPGKLPANNVVANSPPDLVWVRWLSIGRLDETFSRSTEAMRDETGYRPLATNLSYTLWRRELDGSSWIPGGGSVDLRLEQAAARYSNGFLNLPVVIESGRLQLNFADQSFSTQLAGRLADSKTPAGLESLANTQTLLNLNGTIDAQGRMLGRGAGADLTGGIALDKKSAGYLFSAPAPYGQIDGVTLWKR